MLIKNRERIRKEIRKRAARQLAEGLPIEAQPEHVAAVAVALKDKLNDPKDLGRAGSAARMIAGVFDRSVAQIQLPFKLGCQEGCSSCCYIFTSVTAPEVFSIVRHLREQHTPTEIDAIKQRCEPVISKTIDSRFGAGIPCPLLVDSRCSVYQSRPLACRQCASTSRKACDDAFGGSDNDIPYSGAHILSGNNAKLALHSAIVGSHKQPKSYELGQALKLALEAPYGEIRWLQGEDIFSAVQTDDTRGDEHSRRIKIVADLIE